MDPESSSRPVAIDSSIIATDLDDKFKTLKSSYEKYSVRTSSEGATIKLPLIQKVPLWFRNQTPNSEKHYEPWVMAIGPIHHDKSGLVEDYKLGLAHFFIANCFNGGEIQTAYHKIKVDIKNLRNRYEEEVIENYNDDNLAWMLFVDGCAVLASISEYVNRTPLGNSIMKRDFVVHCKHDMFLLENQLPYEVLESLMNSSNNSDGLKKTVEKFIFLSAHPSGPIKKAPDLPSKRYHLLELLRSSMLQPFEGSERNICGGSNPLDCIIDIFCQGKTIRHPTFRSITELKTSGIRVKKSGTVNLTGISFVGEGSLCATLKLPSMQIDDFTAPKFLNLAAYEMCPDFFNDLEISSYVCFMDSLIDKAEDVKKLRDAGVLDNFLGSDEEVARLFNEISNNLVQNDSIYNDVKQKIQKHYKNKWMTWLSQFFHDHFSSPWSVLALFGALAALVLTFLQTWESLRSSKNSSTAA